MEQEQRLRQMTAYLESERGGTDLPPAQDEAALFRQWRSLVNVRPPRPIGREYLALESAYLSDALAARGAVDLGGTEDFGGGLHLWQGDITRLSCDAVVNAANSGMTGCYAPCHACIDNCIHTFAGVPLRLECAALMEAQGHPEPTGRAKLTKGYALPAGHVLHTVGPIVSGSVTAEDRRLLASCYRSCLELAAENGLHSLAFCCISTGEFHFPNEAAAEIAVETVRAFLAETRADLQVVFNVFKDRDDAVYRQLLGQS